MAGGEGEVDYVCDECRAHHYQCCECGEETIGADDEEMCERCFCGLVEMSGVVRSLRRVLSGGPLASALAALQIDHPQQFKKA